MSTLQLTLRVAAALALASSTPGARIPPSAMPIGGHTRPNGGSAEDSTGVQLVRLRRRQGRTSGEHSTGSSFFTARVFVGQPQPQALDVAFDTASGQVILPTAECGSHACLEHRNYRPEVSALAVDINADGNLVEVGRRFAASSTSRDATTIGFSSLDLGDGKVTGYFMADAVCLHMEAAAANRNGSNTQKPVVWPSAACAEVGLVAATELSDAPFRAAPYDGSIGLGMKGLSIRSAFSFLETLGATATPGNHIAAMPDTRALAPALQQFALYHGRAFGEAAFGGYNPNRLASPLQWTPVVNPQDGYWQVSILSLRIGNHTLVACQDGSCRGIIDSSTSKLGIPSQMMPDFEAALSGRGCAGPEIHMEVPGGFKLTLRPEDYAQRVDTSAKCEPTISPLDLPDSFAGVFILGEPLLRRYYTVFDWKEGSERIGFGLAAAVAEDGEEERNVAAAEAAEDLEEAKMTSLPVEQEDGLRALLQALLIRVVLVMGMVLLGTQLVPAKAFLESLLAYKGLLREVAEFATAVPPSEVPDGDECVICLGSCEDEPDIVSGVPGLQRPASAEEGGCTNLKCNGSRAPRWRRLRCGHHFHETCIFAWLRKAKQCPVCRQDFSNRGNFELPSFPFLGIMHAGILEVGQAQ